MDDFGQLSWAELLLWQKERATRTAYNFGKAESKQVCSVNFFLFTGCHDGPHQTELILFQMYKILS